MIYLIAAYDRNRVIGYEGKIPWHLKKDLAHFKKLTWGNIVIMGKKTYLSLPKPLVNRDVWVLSHDLNLSLNGIRVFTSLNQAIKEAGVKDVFIAGGARVYQEALPLADKLILTEIDVAFKGDTYFPEFAKEDYVMEAVEEFEEAYKYRIVTYAKRKNLT